MYNLIIKDILVQKKTVLFSLIYILFFFVVFKGLGAGMFTAAVVAFTYMLVQTSCAYDDRNKSDIMINSLPVKRSSIVLSKYLSVYVFMFLGTVAYIVFSNIIQLIGLPLGIYPLTLEGIAGGVFAVTLLNSIYLPALFKVGYIKSKILNFVLFFGFFFGASSLVNMVMQNKDNALVQTFITFFNSLSEFSVILLMVVILILIIGVSFSLSVRFYKNREF